MPPNESQSIQVRIGKMRILLLISLMTCTFVGCGDPPLYPVKGKITLNGKPYERLLVYFHPIDREPTPFTMGVGETSNDGTLGMRSTAGDGLAQGKYRISFACYVVQGSSKQTVGLEGGKADDDRRHVTKDIVPAPYNSPEESPVEFEVKSGSENFLEFDIPAS